MASASLIGWSSLAIFSCLLNNTAASSESHSAICFTLILVGFFPEHSITYFQESLNYYPFLYPLNGLAYLRPKTSTIVQSTMTGAVSQTRLKEGCSLKSWWIGSAKSLYRIVQFIAYIYSRQEFSPVLESRSKRYLILLWIDTRPPHAFTKHDSKRNWNFSHPSSNHKSRVLYARQRVFIASRVDEGKTRRNWNNLWHSK